MDDETLETEETSFGQALTQAFIISAAASAGTVVGFVVMGFALKKFDTIKENRAAKNAAKTEN